jgi:Asp-tRNA(Asn)/Glu-tRNA(Gln) amidotransferase A subunit family amidase
MSIKKRGEYMGEQHRISQAIRRWREAADPAASKRRSKIQKLAQRRREVAAKKSRSMRQRQLIPGEKLRLRMRGLTASTTKPVEDVQLTLVEQLRAQGHHVVDAALPEVVGSEWADVDFTLDDDVDGALNDLARDHNEAEQAKLDAATERKDAAQRARDARHGITRWPDTVHLLDES